MVKGRRGGPAGDLRWTAREARRIALVTQAEVPRLTFSGIFSGMLERISTGARLVRGSASQRK